MRTSTSGSGMPTEPIFFSPRTGFATTAICASVSEYPSTITPPVSSSKRRCVSAISAAAPQKHSLIERKSTFPSRASLWFRIALSSVGTAQMNAGFTVSISFSMSPKSRGFGMRRDRVVVDEREALHPGVAVRVKQRQREHDRVGPLVHRAPEPRAQLQAGRDHAAMRSDDAFRRAGRSAAHQDDRRVVRLDAMIRPRRAAVLRDEVGETVVAVAKRDVLAFLLLLEQRVAHAERERQVLLDAGGDESFQRSPRLHPLQLVVIAVEHHDRFGTARGKRFLKLAVGVRGVHRTHNGAGLPCAELGDEELRAVGQAQRDAIARNDATCNECRGKGVALALELRVAHPVSLEEQRRPVRMRARALRQVVEQRALRIWLERGRHVRVVVGEPGTDLRHQVSSRIVSVIPRGGAERRECGLANSPPSRSHTTVPCKGVRRGEGSLHPRAWACRRRLRWQAITSQTGIATIPATGRRRVIQGL